MSDTLLKIIDDGINEYGKLDYVEGADVLNLLLDARNAAVAAKPKRKPRKPKTATTD